VRTVACKRTESQRVARGRNNKRKTKGRHVPFPSTSSFVLVCTRPELSLVSKSKKKGPPDLRSTSTNFRLPPPATTRSGRRGTTGTIVREWASPTVRPRSTCFCFETLSRVVATRKKNFLQKERNRGPGEEEKGCPSTRRTGHGRSMLCVPAWKPCEPLVSHILTRWPPYFVTGGPTKLTADT
jgi:hypothetical protein